MSVRDQERYLGVRIRKNGRRQFKDKHLLQFMDRVDGQQLSVFISYDNKHVLINRCDWKHEYWRVVIEGTPTGNNFIGISP